MNTAVIIALNIIGAVMIMMILLRTRPENEDDSIRPPTMEAFRSADKHDEWGQLLADLQLYVTSMCDSTNVNRRNARRLTSWMLRHYYGMTYEEIAFAMGVTRGTSYTTVKRADESALLEGIRCELIRGTVRGG